MIDCDARSFFIGFHASLPISCVTNSHDGGNSLYNDISQVHDD